jgi:PAS domain S-box-containing protein
MTENVSDLIVLLDRQGHRTWNNPAYSQALGYTSEELAGTYALSEVHPDDQTRANAALNKTIESGSTEETEYRVQHKDGTWIDLLARLVPMFGPDGMELVVLTCVDITEKKKLLEALSLSTTESTASTMVEAMARDFDQILINVMGNIAIAKNLNGPHNAVAVRLNEIERSLQRARDLIEQMSSISPQKGQPKVRIEIEPTVQEIVGGVLRGTMMRAEYLFPRHLPELELDLEAFTHVIRNIITNSVQAMDKGVVRISAELVPRDQFAKRPDIPLKPGEYVRLQFRDQGHGIPEKALPRVFEPYFTTRSGSQGLGLSTALSSIHRMGGTILIDSTPGVGTTVSIYFPTSASGAIEEPSMPKPAQSTTSPSSRSGAAASSSRSSTPTMMPMSQKKKRILLMDDEQMILDIVSRMLGHLGYEVITCTDGAQAIAAFTKAKSQGEPFDLVMMDLVIPNGVGGQDAVHTIKKIDPSARVIASSGHLDHPVMVEHDKFGFNAVLEKPYKMEKLQQVIETVINLPA